MPNCVETVRWVSVVGARPQFIKLSPLVRAVELHNESGQLPRVEHRIINTGQHYDREMAELIIDQLKMSIPDYNLEVGSGSHGEQLARMLECLEPVLIKERPDWVIVYGDTNSTLAGALVAARLCHLVAHVEAGCRCYSRLIPEEQNRVSTDHLSQLLFAPSRRAMENLWREGIGTSDDPRKRTVTFVGDTMYDAFLENCALAGPISRESLKQFGLESKRYYLLTVHRAENTTHPQKVQSILEMLEDLDLPVLFPAHPRTRKVLSEAQGPVNGRNIRMVSPLGYLDMLAIGMHARKIITDSGGVQKEALYMGVPCVTLRHETEWPETVEIGANRLVGTNRTEVLNAIRDPTSRFNRVASPFGEGNASRLIVEQLLAAGPLAR